MSPETSNTPEAPKLEIVPSVPELTAREDGSNPLLMTPEEQQAAIARQDADGRTAELAAAQATYAAENPSEAPALTLVENEPVQDEVAEGAPQIPQNILDSQNLISAAADSVRQWSENAVQQPQPADPANMITVPEEFKPAPVAPPVVEAVVLPPPPETPPQV